MENYLTQITNYLLTQSWQIAVLVVAIAAVNLALKNRSSHVRYLLWLIVLAKCLAPPLLTVPLAILPEEKTSVPVPISLAQMPTVAFEVVDMSTAEVPVAPAVAVPAPTVTEKPARLTTRQWIGFGWIVGVAAFFLFAVIKALRTNFWLWRQRKPLPAKIQIGIEKLFSSLDLKTFPKVWLVEGIGQPFVWGLLRGSIYLPADFIKINSDEHQRGILGHELSHILRFDAAVNVLQIIAQAVFWFHPFVWWVNRRIRAEREKCCDEMTIARLGAKAKEYSTAIVNILTSEQKSTRPVPSLAVAGPVKNIEERIKTMLRPGRKFYRRPSLIAAITVFLVAFLTVPTALVLTARAGTETPRPETRSTRPLHEAAAAGDIEKVKSLISKGADVNEKDPGGKTPLHCASEKGHTEVARLLLAQGAYVNAIGWEMTPLHFAAMSGDKKTVELLLSKGAHINAKTRQGRTPLFKAMASPAVGREEVVELLVSKGAKIPELHLAAYLGDMEKLKKYLQDEIDINSQEDFGSTALHAAANSGKKDIVEFLISKGANVDAKDAYYGVTPLYYAAMHNYEDIADLLLAKGADVNAKEEDGHYTLLYYAIWDNSKDAIKLLISKGANVNVKDESGYTPLVFAVWENDKDMVELLIDKGADINIEDNDGYTPLYWAAMEGNKELVELLTAKGATPISAIHLAARAGDLAKVKSLIEAGADINARDKGGGTPLFSAVFADHDDVARFLIAQGADVNAKDKNDMTPLHDACRRGRKDGVELLISKGADVNAKDSEGSTPLHLVFFSGRMDVAELLIAKGADINAKDNKERTALSLAKEQGHEGIVELLRKHGAKE